MRAYLIRRLLLIIPTLFVLSLLVFFSLRFIPGDAIDVLMVRALESGSSLDIDREELEERLGLNAPVHVQYGRWIEGMFLHGTLGESLQQGWTVEDKMLGRLPVTIELGALAIIIGLVIALPVGIYSAMRQDTAADYIGRTIAIIGMATPNFWLAIMVMIYPAIWWGWSPPIEVIPFTEDPLGNLGVFIIPSMILGTAMSAGTMRLMRTVMLEVLRQDYVRTAWAKGLKERVVIMRHVVKNSLVPVVTLVGAQIPLMVGGSVILENIFALPGIGRLFLVALNNRDYPVVQGINLFLSIIVMLNVLLIDMIYPYLDPRIRYK